MLTPQFRRPPFANFVIFMRDNSAIPSIIQFILRENTVCSLYAWRPSPQSPCLLPKGPTLHGNSYLFTLYKLKITGLDKSLCINLECEVM
jgi:hypothetical protein